MLLLKKQGFDSHAEQLSDNLAETWFDKKEEFPKIKEPEEIQLQSTHNWDEILNTHQLQTIDVRHFPMP